MESADKYEETPEQPLPESPSLDGSAGSSASSEDRLPFPVVGIGASAGGLEAFERFFQSLPKNPGMAFVLVQHLDPERHSERAGLLQRYTEMEVRQVTDVTRVEVDHVYVIPPGKALSIRGGLLHLCRPASGGATARPSTCSSARSPWRRATAPSASSSPGPARTGRSGSRR